MSVKKNTNQLIPLLVQGNLEKNESARVLEEIRQSPELQAEYDFWQGIYAIRRVMPCYDSSNHPFPETLDRFAQGRMPQLSPEYSEIAGHLQQCPGCTEDVELLRQTVRHLPEEKVHLAREKSVGFLASLFGMSEHASKWLAPVASVFVIVFGLYFLSNRGGEPKMTAVILLQPQFEKRSAVDQNNIPEMQVSLKRRTNKVIIGFDTDRIDSLDYDYSIYLNPKAGAPLALSDEKIECEQSELTNHCELTVTKKKALTQLKQGGSFSLSIKETFPEGVKLEPREWEYHLLVTMID